MAIETLLSLAIASYAATIFLTFLFSTKTIKAKPFIAFMLIIIRSFALLWFCVSISLLFKLQRSFNLQFGSPYDAINLTPFKTIRAYVTNWNDVQIIGNLFAMLPLPIFLQLSFPRLRLVTISLIAILTTAIIEPLQLLMNIVVSAPHNVIDIDDFLLNLIGCVTGLILTLVIKRLLLMFKISDNFCTDK